MSKAQAMLEWTPPPQPNGKPQDEPPPPDQPDPRQPGRNRATRQRWGALLRVVRQGEVSQPTSWRPWWLLGLLEVVTHPLPRFLAGPVLYVPGVRAYAEFPARPPMFIPVAA